ncbi:hypothetical protein HZQ12_10480 [Elizabethkingia anophelis]|nr:hypothetical protein [Elizabethkingia anophelis]MCT3977329.1 hypothetical protein [Elizabethkingia anophelis]MCT4040793.1 hypothetical protein [Elizabethkingia anophelis]
MKKKNMINIKAIKSLLFCGVLLFIISCRSDQQNNLTESVKGVSFSVSVDDFGNSDTKNQANIRAVSNNTNIISKQELTSGPFNIVSELSEDTNNKISTRSFLPGARKFRIVAYDSQTGDYTAQDVGSTSAPNQKLFENISLVGGRKYTFITYSLNSNTDPPIAPTTNLNQAKINLSGLNGEEAGTDLLYAINENVMISGGNTVINVTLKHQFSRIILSVDNLNATGTPGQPGYIKGSYLLDNNDTGGFTGTVQDYYTSGNLNMKDASITEGVNSGLSVSGITTTAKTLIINTGSEDIYKSKLIIPPGAIVIGNDSNSSPVTIAINGRNDNGLQPGASYTLKLKFNSDRYVDENGTTQSKNNARYAVIGGYRWDRFNLGVTSNVPSASNDPDVIRKEIHGAKYQWSAMTGQTGYYLSQQDDQAYSTVTWSTIWHNNTSWHSGDVNNPLKTISDPCDSGNRVPSYIEYEKLISNTFNSPLGSLSSGVNNYNSGRRFYSRRSPNVQLTLPAAGFRAVGNSIGQIINRGSIVNYWATTHRFVGGINSTTENASVGLGYPIRCIQE